MRGEELLSEAASVVLDEITDALKGTSVSCKELRRLFDRVLADRCGHNVIDCHASIRIILGETQLEENPGEDLLNCQQPTRSSLLRFVDESV